MPPVARYTLRRLVLAAITMVGVVIAVFLMTHILPSDPAALRAGPLATEELIAQYKQEMGLDKSLVVQFLNYAGLLARGDLGISYNRAGLEVTTILREFFPVSLQLGLLAMLIAVIVGVTLGLIAAVNHNSHLDYLASFFSIVGVSTPFE